MSNKTIYAPCRFCGQIMTLEVNRAMTDEEEVELASIECNCKAGDTYRTLIAKRQVANENIEVLFGRENDIVEIMKAAVSSMCTDKLESITLNLAGGVKAKVTKNSKGEFSVERSDTEKKKLTY